MAPISWGCDQHSRYHEVIIVLLSTFTVATTRPAQAARAKNGSVCVRACVGNHGSCQLCRNLAGSGGNWRELAGKTARKTEKTLAGTGGNWRELAGTGGEPSGNWRRKPPENQKKHRRELAGSGGILRDLAGSGGENRPKNRKNTGGNLRELAGTGGEPSGNWRGKPAEKQEKHWRELAGTGGNWRE